MCTAKVSGKSKSATLKIAVALLAVLFLVIPATGLLSIDLSQASGGGWDDDRDDDDDNDWRRPGFCSQTAKVVFKACRNEVKDDFLIAIGNCINVSDADERKECKTEAREEKEEGNDLCKEQFEARLEVCDLVGEKRYDPDFDPENFVNPLLIGSDDVPANEYFPLVQGTQWIYEGTFTDDEGEEVTETITVTVTDKIKLIEGVTCVVVNDLVEEDDVKIEVTDDWYAQDEDGNVWYCGEIAKNFETIEGDDPEEPELVDIEGSWKAGRDYAKPGILMLAHPKVGDAYRQEVSWGDAEDVAEVISITGSAKVPAAVCDNDCLITRDFTPIEPGINENKYYMPGVGLILEVDMEGNRVELISKTPTP